jgi:hypothetical protein
VARVLAVQPVLNNANHHIVADQVARFHRLPSGQAHGAPQLTRLAQDVARRNLGQPPDARQAFGLRALTGPRRTEHYDIQRVRGAA